jgi:hypothetical protein
MSSYKDYRNTLLLVIKHKKCPYIICGKDCPLFFKAADFCGGKLPFRSHIIIDTRVNNCIKEYIKDYGEGELFDELL